MKFSFAVGIIIAVLMISLFSSSSILGFSFGNAQALTLANAVGDIGCKSNSISNLKNLDASPLPLIGVGDYLYKCSLSSVQKYYDGINKVGGKGNHEEQGEGKAWAKNAFRYFDRGYTSWILNDIAIIILDPYQSFDKNSNQYKYVVAKSEQFAARPGDINWIVYLTHEPLWTPTVKGGSGPHKDMRSVYGPLIAKYNGFLLNGHNHITAFGTVDNIPQAICGGGGYGGDSLGDLNGWEWATATKFGYCKFEFQKNAIIGQLISASDGKVIRSFTWLKPTAATTTTETDLAPAAPPNDEMKS
jgi:hypothetical protein